MKENVAKLGDIPADIRRECGTNGKNNYGWNTKTIALQNVALVANVRYVGSQRLNAKENAYATEIAV